MDARTVLADLKKLVEERVDQAAFLTARTASPMPGNFPSGKFIAPSSNEIMNIVIP